MDTRQKQYQEACLKEVKTLMGGKIVGTIRDNEGCFGLRIRNNGKLWDMWIDADAEGNGPGFPCIEAGDK